MTVPTNGGFAEMAKHATGTGSPVAFTKIAVGIGSGQGASDTTLDSEVTDTGLARATAGTISTVQTTVADDTGSWVHVFTATGSKTITEAGIFNASSGGDMLIVGAVSPEAAMVNGDTLTLTMKCQFKAD
jgi:hypothetical protein